MKRGGTAMIVVVGFLHAAGQNPSEDKAEWSD